MAKAVSTDFQKMMLEQMKFFSPQSPMKIQYKPSDDPVKSPNPWKVSEPPWEKADCREYDDNTGEGNMQKMLESAVEKVLGGLPINSFTAGHSNSGNNTVLQCCVYFEDGSGKMFKSVIKDGEPEMKISRFAEDVFLGVRDKLESMKAQSDTSAQLAAAREREINDFREAQEKMIKKIIEQEKKRIEKEMHDAAMAEAKKEIEAEVEKKVSQHIKRQVSRQFRQRMKEEVQIVGHHHNDRQFHLEDE